jgi:hypothetical protein
LVEIVPPNKLSHGAGTWQIFEFRSKIYFLPNKVEVDADRLTTPEFCMVIPKIIFKIDKKYLVSASTFRLIMRTLPSHAFCLLSLIYYKERSVWKICLRLWKDMWKSLN